MGGLAGLPWVREMPTLGRMRGVVMFTLAADIAGKWVEVGWAERFGPIASLPVDGDEGGQVIGVKGAAALHSLNEVGEASGWRELDQSVDVVGTAAASE